MKKILPILFLLISAYQGYSQCDSYFSSLRCRPGPHEVKDMVLSSQSRGAQLEAHQTYNFNMTLFRNMDYRIIFCTKRKFYPIHFVITEIESGVILFDNKDDDYVESIGFTTENTTAVTVQVTLLAEGAKFEDFRQNRACIGIPILFRKVTKLGL